MIRDIIIDVLLALGVTTALLSVVGVLVMRTALQRLHYLGPLAMVAPVLIGVAVAIARNANSAVGLKALLVVAIIVIFAPMLTHQTGQLAE